MAKNYDVEFDSDNFVDTFAEDAAPTFTPSPAGTKKKTTKSPSVSMPQETQPRQPTGNTDTRGAPPDSGYTKEEEEFIERFLTRTRFTKVSQNGKQVAVSDRHLKKIRKLTLLFGEGATLSGYLYNVLEEHFRQFDPILQSLLQKELTKD